MVPEFQKPRVTEIHARMDCNGCVQKIKKALNGINGICDLYIDFPQQKITIIGWADPEKIVKAIKKTRKMATICNIEPTESPSQPAEPSPQQTEPEPEENAQALKATQPQEAEFPPAQEGSPEKPPKDIPQPEQPPHEATLSPTATPAENNTRQQSQNTPVTKDVGEVHVVHHHPPDYGNRVGSGHSYVGHWDRYHNSPALLQEPPQPAYVTHSYNTYRPSPYVTEYEYVRSPPRHTHYNRMEYYSADYHNSNGNITSMLSDENPNACRIV
ncbi:pollen-specific leucine-rich repeat extensin-like protein 1 [Gastrolobium bilobum]|uniref:pollen-specific leucine-rich repeat extensin-like protein 1 n=1 Tax=Gastrolobium bilobum TaxID=150636 RepID=UPI002AB112BE|nr:pollen-specific leucine-rich repeat extensin-like protein 1 [Gastrolobium bilobum]